LKGIQTDAPVKRKNSWMCNACELSRLSNRNTQLITPNTDLVSKIDNILSVVEEIKSSVSKHEISLRDVNSKLSTVSEQLRSLVDLTSSLECRLHSVETRLSNVEKTKSYADKTIINEVIERQTRFRNLIVLNVPDQTKNTPTNDMDFIKSLFVALSINLQPTTFTRLGKISDKPRPIKITLPEASDVFATLKVKHRLYGSPNFERIRIFSYRTIMQRNQLRNIKLKLEERKATGESNLVLKFLRGVPTISKNMRTGTVHST
jgi:hypothetical protein